MLNYVWAELYKLRHKKALFIGMGLLLAVESLVCVPMALVSVQSQKQEVMLVSLVALSLTGVYAAPAFAALAFDDQYAHGTLKNEIVFGIPRRLAYLGKLCAGAIAGTVAAAVAVGWYLALCLVSAGHMAPPLYWEAAFTALLGAWMTWMAALSLAHFLLAAFSSGLGATLVANIINLLLVPVGLMGYTGRPLWFAVLSHVFYSAPYAALWGEMGLVGEAPGLNPLLYALLIMVGWVAITTALGLLVLRRREIR